MRALYYLNIYNTHVYVFVSICVFFLAVDFLVLRLYSGTFYPDFNSIFQIFESVKSWSGSVIYYGVFFFSSRKANE